MCLEKSVAFTGRLHFDHYWAAGRTKVAMSRTAVLERPTKDTSIRQPTPSDDEDKSSSDVDFVLDGEIEKDDTEKELERLVFGDAAGVKNGFKDFSLLDEELDPIGQTGLEGLADADVCPQTCAIAIDTEGR